MIKYVVKATTRCDRCGVTAELALLLPLPLPGFIVPQLPEGWATDPYDIYVYCATCKAERDT